MMPAKGNAGSSKGSATYCRKNADMTCCDGASS